VEVGQERVVMHEPIEGYKTLTRQRSWRPRGIVDDLQLPHRCICMQQLGRRVTSRRDRNDEGARRAARDWPNLQFHAYGGDDWTPMRSRRWRSRRRSRQSNLTTDGGRVFGDAVTITADGPWQHCCISSPAEVGNLDVENETGLRIVPTSTRTVTSSMRAMASGRAAAHHDRGGCISRRTIRMVDVSGVYLKSSEC
jgi:hypothetical protein